MAEFPYFVIELERFPHASYQPFIAVPSSWISMTLSQGLRVAVHLPNVDFKTMECLTKSGRGPGDNWGFYLGTQHMGNGNIEDAWKYAEYKNSRRGSNQKQEEASIEVRKRKRINYEYGRSYVCYDRLFFSHAQVEQGKIERDLRYEKRRAKAEAKEIKNRKKGDVVKTAQLTKSAQPLTSSSGMMQKHKKLSIPMKDNNYRKKKLMRNLAKTIQYQDEKFNELREALNSLTPVFSNISHSINAAVSVIQDCLNDLENEIDDKVDDNVVDVTPKAGPSRLQDSKQPKAKIVYEYPDNSDKSKKWMLKYPEFQYMAGLVELLPGSGIYVNETALNRCRENCKDPTELAHSLIDEVFSDAALDRCATSDEYLVDALDYYALVVIEMYVKEFC